MPLVWGTEKSYHEHCDGEGEDTAINTLWLVNKYLISSKNFIRGDFAWMFTISVVFCLSSGFVHPHSAATNVKDAENTLLKKKDHKKLI